jgi:phosphatidylserine/phosphatidylglycerophosphate/cardiolipin synthase-like enzyme
MMVEGEAAAALGDLARMRWKQSGGEEFPPCRPQKTSPWPKQLKAEFENVEIGIARTRAAWNGSPEVREIEALFVAHIARAKKFVYAESQYFASRRIAEAMAERLSEADPPEIVLVNPKAAHGWLEPIAMDTARARLLEFVHRADHADRFRLYHPVTAAGRPIYVHAKVLIVDDMILHSGSANMNNRSLRLDTECDLTIDARFAGNAAAGDAVRGAIGALRETLLAEHLGVAPAAVRAAMEGGSLIAAIEKLRGPGRSLVPLEMPRLSDVEKWLADNELLDPEGAEEMFKPLSQRRGLLRRLRRRFHRRRPRRPLRRVRPPAPVAD